MLLLSVSLALSAESVFLKYVIGVLKKHWCRKYLLLFFHSRISDHDQVTVINTGRRQVVLSMTCAAQHDGQSVSIALGHMPVETSFSTLYNENI